MLDLSHLSKSYLSPNVKPLSAFTGCPDKLRGSSLACTGGEDSCAFASSITGVGETIIRADLARGVCEEMSASREELPAEVCARTIRARMLNHSFQVQKSAAAGET